MNKKQPILTHKQRHLFEFETRGEIGQEIVIEKICPFYFRADRLVTIDSNDGQGTTFKLYMHDQDSDFGRPRLVGSTWAYPRESIYDIVKAIKLARTEGYHAVADKIENDFLTGEDVLRSDLLLDSDRALSMPVSQPNSWLRFKIKFAVDCLWLATLSGWAVK